MSKLQKKDFLKDKKSGIVTVGLMVLCFLIVAVWLLPKPEQSIEVEEEVVPTESGSMEAQTVEKKLIWEYGEIAPQFGITDTVEKLLASDKVYARNGGTAAYMTFADENAGSVYVLAGTETEQGICGSLWKLTGDSDVALLKQQITVAKENHQYVTVDYGKYLVLNYWEDDKLNGKILSLTVDAKEELFPQLPGRKVVSEDGAIQCLTADDSFVYDFQYLGGGKIRAVSGTEFFGEEDEAFTRVWDNGNLGEREQSYMIGTEYELTETEQDIMQGVLLDCSAHWNDRPTYTEENTNADWNEANKKIYIIQKAENFVAYARYLESSMLVETPDEKMVLIDGYFTSNYGVQPELLERDFDGDGSNELAIIGLTEHGTGVCVDYLYMVDKNSDGKWYAYRVKHDWYEEKLAAHIESKYSAGAQIDFYYEEGSIICKADLLIYSDNPYVGMSDGSQLYMEISYLGDGKWAEKGVRKP